MTPRKTWHSVALTGVMLALAACTGLPGCALEVRNAHAAIEHETSPDVDQPALSELVEDSTAFAFDPYQMVAQEENANLVYSPYSISQALATIYARAIDETERQMQDTLHLALPQDNLHPAASTQSDPASEIVRLVNQLRASRGLPPYQVDSALTVAAQVHTDWCAATGVSTHTGAGGTTPSERALAAGYGSGASAWATENAAHGTLPLSPEFVVMMWQGDPVHLDTMISPRYEHIGVGYAEAGGYAFYFMMVGWVGDSSSPPAQPGAVEEAPSQAETEVAADGQAAQGESVFVLATPRLDGSIVHEVQEGQSLWLIAANYGVDVADLLELNSLPEGAFLHAGDLLLIKPGDTPVAVSTPSQPAAVPSTGTSPASLATEILPPRLAILPTLVPTHTPQPEPARKASTGVIVALAVAGVTLAGVSAWQCLQLRRDLPGTQDD